MDSPPTGSTILRGTNLSSRVPLGREESLNDRGRRPYRRLRRGGRGSFVYLVERLSCVYCRRGHETKRMEERLCVRVRWSFVR